MLLCSQCQTLNDTSSVRCAGCGSALDADSPALGRDPYVGRRLGDRYFLQAALGSGEIGLVYRAMDERTEQPVAVKVIHPDVAAGIGDRLLRSAVAISQVRHAKLASVLAAARESDGTLFITTELLQGQTLKQLLEHHGPLGPRRAADLLFQLCSALAPIHKVGRPHANLKPENVFLTEKDGQPDFVRICDVGVPDLFGVRKTATGQMVIGSPKYFSPEQAQGMVVGVQSDQFTLGVIAYQLLTGALPFFGATPDQLLAAIAAGTPVPIARRTPGLQLPAKLEQVISRCLSKSPADRYADLRALATDVAAVIKSTQPEAVKKKSFVPASTVMADPSQLSPMFASISRSDQADDDADRASAADGGWGSDLTQATEAKRDDRTPAVGIPALLASRMVLSGPPTPIAASPPPAPRPPRPPSQNDMVAIPSPLLVTGAIDSMDLASALQAASASLHASGPPTKPHFSDDLSAAMAAAAADLGEADLGHAGPLGARTSARLADPFEGASPDHLHGSPAGNAASMSTQPGANGGRPIAGSANTRMSDDILSALTAELSDVGSSGSIPMGSSLIAPSARGTLSGLEAVGRVHRPIANHTPRRLFAVIVGLVVLGFVGLYFFVFAAEEPAPVTRARGVARTRSEVSPTAPSLAPSLGSEGAPSAASAPPPPSVLGSLPASEATALEPGADEYVPAVVRAQREKQKEEAARLASAGRLSGLLAVPIMVHIVTEPAGATVYEGAKVMGTTPSQFLVETTGLKTFTLKLAGYDDATVVADPEKAVDATLSLQQRLIAVGGTAPQPVSVAPAAPASKPAAPRSATPRSAAPKPKPKPRVPAVEAEDPY